jgi:hypothetical protein
VAVPSRGFAGLPSDACRSCSLGLYSSVLLLLTPFGRQDVPWPTQEDHSAGPAARSPALQTYTYHIRPLRDSTTELEPAAANATAAAQAATTAAADVAVRLGSPLPSLPTSSTRVGSGGTGGMASAGGGGGGGGELEVLKRVRSDRGPAPAMDELRPGPANTPTPEQQGLELGQLPEAGGGGGEGGAWPAEGEAAAAKAEEAGAGAGGGEACETLGGTQVWTPAPGGMALMLLMIPTNDSQACLLCCARRGTDAAACTACVCIAGDGVLLMMSL